MTVPFRDFDLLLKGDDHWPVECTLQRMPAERPAHTKGPQLSPAKLADLLQLLAADALTRWVPPPGWRSPTE